MMREMMGVNNGKMNGFLQKLLSFSGGGGEGGYLLHISPFFVCFEICVRIVGGSAGFHTEFWGDLGGRNLTGKRDIGRDRGGKRKNQERSVFKTSRK